MIFQDPTPINNNTGFFGRLFTNRAATSNETPPVQGTALDILSIAPVNEPIPNQTPKLTLQNNLGARVSHVAKSISSVPAEIINQAIGTGLASRVLQWGTNQVIDLEMISLELANQARTVVERTSLQELGEVTHTLTDFLNTYQTVFSRLSTRQFASKAEENAAWIAEWQTAGGAPWPAGFQPGAQTPEAINTFIQTTFNRIKENTIENFLAIIRSQLLLRNLAWAQNLVVGQVLNHIPVIHDSIEEIRAQIDAQGAEFGEILYLLTDRPQIYKTVEEQVNRFLTLLENNHFSIPRPEETDIPDHHLLVENVGGRQIVIHSSVPELIGMESQTAQAIWSNAEIVTRTDATPNAFGGRQSLKDKLKTAVYALLTGVPGALRDRACAEISRIRFIGRPLAMMLRVIYFISALIVKGMLKGVNHFVGWPSAEVLSEEIAKNLLLHMNNPAMAAAPALLINRLFSILDGTQSTPNSNSNTTAREAFLGEPIIAVLKLFKTLCPSIFVNEFAYPRLVKGCIGAALWISRKTFSATVLVVVNPLTRKIILLGVKRFSSEATKEQNLIVAAGFLAWVEQSAITIWKSSELLEKSHSILSSGYRMFGEFGAVSTEQSHFTRGSRSAAHLLHHTILACGRMLIHSGALSRIKLLYDQEEPSTLLYDQGKLSTIKLLKETFSEFKRAFSSVEQLPTHMQKKLQFNGLLAKINRQEPVTAAEMEPVSQEITEKLTQPAEELPPIRERMALINAIPPLELRIQEWHADKVAFGNELEVNINAWTALETNIARLIAQQKSTIGEASSELELLFRKIIAIKIKLEGLARTQAEYLSRDVDFQDVEKDEWKDLYSDFGLFGNEQRQLKFELLTLFQKQETTRIEAIAAYAEKIASITAPQTARECISELLRDSEISTFANARIPEEVRLQTSLETANQHLQQVLNEWEAFAVAHLANEETRQNLISAQHDYAVAQAPAIDAIPNALMETRLLNFALNAITKPTEKSLSSIQALDYHLPETFQEFRRRHSEALAQIIEIKNRIAKLPSVPLYADPVRLLERSGIEIFAEAKRTIKVASVIEKINRISEQE